jgi:hypothetical protein
MSSFSAQMLVLSALDGEFLSEGERVYYILHYMNSSDWAVREAVSTIVKIYFPQYIKILNNPSKYSLLK